MRIYVAHSKGIDYLNDLYEPIREMSINEEHEIILPHEFTSSSFTGRLFYKSIDVMIAECSDSTTGLGIELGWAYDDGTPIYCILKKGTKIKESIKTLTDNIVEYTDKEDMVNVINQIVYYELLKRDTLNIDNLDKCRVNRKLV